MARAQARVAVEQVCGALESIAPLGLAQAWDNVGLLAGDRMATVRRILLSIDLTGEVVEEARAARADLVIAYHPPIFKPIKSLLADSRNTDSLVFRCIRHGIAIYSMHTALDAAEGGTNDIMAELCGCRDVKPLQFVPDPGAGECKLVVFIPKEHVDAVADAMFQAGAGRIGDYSHCSYRIAGRGTFLGGDSTHPTIGQRDRFEQVDEIRLETIVPTHRLPSVVDAMKRANPYDEPAFDIYPLHAKPAAGIGRIGILTKATTLSRLAGRLKRLTGSRGVQTVGTVQSRVERVVVVVGAAGTLPFEAPLSPRDCIVTGEIRHHDALTVQRVGCTAIALGHWASERPVLSHLRDRLAEQLPEVQVGVSSRDRDPFRPLAGR